MYEKPELIATVDTEAVLAEAFGANSSLHRTPEHELESERERD